MGTQTKLSGARGQEQEDGGKSRSQRARAGKKAQGHGSKGKEQLRSKAKSRSRSKHKAALHVWRLMPKLCRWRPLRKYTKQWMLCKITLRITNTLLHVLYCV